MTNRMLFLKTHVPGKIARITSCAKCPHHYKGGSYGLIDMCEKSQAKIPTEVKPEKEISPHCPLPNIYEIPDKSDLSWLHQI